MSKKKDTRQLLVESSEFATKISISQTLKESLEMSKGKAGTLIVRNVPCGLLNRVNQNNRIYSTKVVQDAINEAKRNHAFELKNMFGKPNEHPEGSYIAPSEASHVVIDAYVKPNVKMLVDGKEEVNDVLFMDLEVLNTSNGKDMRALLEAECSVGTSIRGLGDLNGQNVENYTLISVDLVGNPSSSTYTRMIMSESVQVELKDPRQLQETYTVTTSSTNVVRDLETASELQAELENIGYGTVVKTSTKLDSETDPKTGAETTITTLEAETEDDVGDLDQALMMAKNAMLNGRVNIDSVTIENVKEEQPQESTENKVNNEKTLNEEETDPTYLALKKSNFYRFNTPEEYMQYINDNVNYLGNHTLPEAEEIFAEYKSGKISPELACHKFEGFVNAISMNYPFELDSDYIPESEMPKDNISVNESILVEADKLYDEIYEIIQNQNVPVDKACRIYCEKHDNIPYEYVLEYMKDVPGMEEAVEEYQANQVGSPEKVAENMVQRQYNFIISNLLESNILRQQAENIFAKFERGEINAIDTKIALGDVAYEVQKKLWGESKDIKEATEEKKDPKEGKKFVLKTPSGFVAMDGNALVFKNDPKQALHFISGKEESGLVHLSGVQKILDTMGVYDVEKYYRKPTTDISATLPDEIANNEDSVDISNTEIEQKEAKLTEKDNTGGKFTAIVNVEELGGEVKSEEIPVASTELNSMQNEIGNLYQQKSKNGQVYIKIRDNESGKMYMYNPEMNTFDELQESTDGTIEQDDNKLSIEIDDDHTIEKEFDTKAQASVAKAGVEQGKLDGDVLLNEDENNNWKIAVLFNNLKFDDEEQLYNNADPTSGQKIFNTEPKFVRIFLYPEELNTEDFEKLIITNEGNKYIENKAFEKLENKLGARGELYSIRVWDKNENPEDMEDKDFEKNIYTLTEDEDECEYHYSGIEQANWENPDNPSLSYDLENSAICAWCGDRLPKHEMKHERKLGWLCNHCARGLQSREGKLEFEEDNNQYDDIEAGWYVSCPNHMEIGISGPYQSKEEASKGLEEYEDMLSFDYISPEDIQQFEENNKMDEVLYKRASNPSDPYIDKPLNEEDNNPNLFDTLYYYKNPKSYIMFNPQDDNTIKVTTSFKVNNADGEDWETGDDIVSKEDAAKYWNKLYNSSLYTLEPSYDLDEAKNKPSEDDINNNPDENIQITLGDIDWDVDSITNNFMSNAQPDDVATEGDINSLINDLPDTLTLTVKAKDMNMDEPDEVRKSLMDLANKTSGLKINNATILDIK